MKEATVQVRITVDFPNFASLLLFNLQFAPSSLPLIKSNTVTTIQVLWTPIFICKSNWKHQETVVFCFAGGKPPERDNMFSHSKN